MEQRRSKRIAEKIAKKISGKKSDMSSPRSAITNSKTNSKISTTSSQKRLLIARAIKEKAELEIQIHEHETKRLSSMKTLIEAKLDEDMALLDDANASFHSDEIVEARPSSQTKNDNDIITWVDETTRHIPSTQDPPKQVDDIVDKLTLSFGNAMKSVFSNQQHVATTTMHDKLLGRLAARDLPIFSGDPIEWLLFKNAYDNTTSVGQFSEGENIARLQKCLRGDAWEAVSASLITATSADQIMTSLEMRFGRPDLVLHKVINEIKKIPKLTEARSELVTLATKVNNCVAAIKATKHVGHLHNPDLITDIISKLTEPLYYRWLDYGSSLDTWEPKLPALAKYLMTEAQLICKLGICDVIVKTSKQTFKRPVFLTTEEEAKPNLERQKASKLHTRTYRECQFCHKGSHNLENCHDFMNMEINNKWEWICKNGLCFKCLSSSHKRDKCKSKKKCSSCKARHHSILHRNDWAKKEPESNSESPEITANTWTGNSKKVYLKVLPVKIEGPTGTLSTYALLDEGSTVTLLDSQTAESVGIRGPKSGLNLQYAIGDCGKMMTSQTVSLIIHSSEDSYRLDRVRTVDNLNLPIQEVRESDLSKYTHLKNIPLQTFKGRPTLLIGQDYWHLIVTREIREGKKNEPVASLTRLGWVLHGFKSSITKVYSNHVMHVSETNINSDNELHELVKDYFRLESIGITPKDVQKQSTLNQRALDILNLKSRRKEDRWETGLLWKSDEVKFPDNKRYAELRLKAIEKRMDCDSSFAADYSKQVNNLFENDYAEEVIETSVDKKIWYLPHFGVKNPNKPNKLRLVFDAKAETKGISLNTELLAGPDLLNSLIGILLRFRERPFAVTGDIKEMFLRVKVLEEDQLAQCFLWRGMDREKPPRTYKMTSLIFGAKSSPCTATYIMRRNAEDFISSHPRAVAAIKRRHYVDDYVDSVDTEEELVQIISDVTMIHKAAGFEIRGWATNCPNILPQGSQVNVVKLPSLEKTLGMIWRTKEDCLEFDLSFNKIHKDVSTGLRKPTKREMLKIIMSVFDPLGLLCPLLIRGKIMLQDVWRSGIQWDQCIGDKQYQIWRRWLDDLDKCKKFFIARCYGFTYLNNLQLHIFVDASEQAYAAVAYLKEEDKVAFVAAKSRVAPLKSSTIPRLELQAALMGARLGDTIIKELDVKINKCIYWTDSQTVWWWINSKYPQNRPFISNRLAEIEELTQVYEWRWLPGKINVADEATRLNGSLSNSKWITGPEFLRHSEVEWPSVVPGPKLEEEINAHENHEFALVTEETVKLIDDKRFSNWRRLVRSVAMVLLFVDKCKQSTRQISLEHERRAESIIIRQAQAESFSAEIDALTSRQKLKPTSKLQKINSTLDEDNILRAITRIEAAKDLPFDLKKPVILDGRHHVSKLIIDYRHRKLGHHSSHILINELKQKYCILRLRTTVRSLIARCVICKARRAPCEQPMMAGLPPARLEHHCRPFTYCGVDLFGPMLITIGRRNEKRWGAIFTCLNTRAVHIELVASLTTDSTILAIRRMAARRGYPKQMYSDNGTNFRGADRELQISSQELFRDKAFIGKTIELGIEWRFNAPDAPHMGGVWERLVRSIKTALHAILFSRAPKEETLSTLLAEAENIVNSRPLTHVSVDVNEEEALTPNHFLLGASNGLPRPGDFSDEDLKLRKQWRISQRLADHFWNRWIREYIPCLQDRQKWTKDNSRKICVGDLVLIADSSSPRNVWPRGKVIAVVPGRDGRIRIVDVATQSGTLRRPVSKLVVLLPASQN